MTILKGEKPVKSKLNSCGACGSKVNLKANYDVNRKLYFLCEGCDKMDKILSKECDKAEAIMRSN